MTKQDYRHSILSLSACSIPVMLAVAGWGGASNPTDIHSSLSFCEGSSVRQSADTEELLEHQNDSAQNDANWICMSPDKEHFWVSKGRDTAISTYRFTDSSGNFELLDIVNDLGGLPVANESTDSWIDLELSDDGQFLYQVFGESGTMGVYEVDGGSLTLVEVLSA